MNQFLSKISFVGFTLLILLTQNILGNDLGSNKGGENVESLTNRLNRLEALFEKSVTTLETQVQELKEKISILVPEENSISINLSNNAKDEAQDNLQPAPARPTSSILPRTCYEILQSDPTNFTPGSYRIDPMGLGVDSIAVTCNAAGTTLVSHDSETPTTITSCVGVACYNKIVTYPGAPLKQLNALSFISSTCRQSFRYDCTASPFEYNGVQYSYWNDIYGNVKDYWAGPKSSSHTCQCGIDRNCIQVGVTCNCDSLSNTPLVDEGYISDKEALPVTQLHFGRSSLAGSLGRYTLGKLECSGRSAFAGKPAKCQDLYEIGHVLNGFYPIQTTGKIEMVYCDFSSLSASTGISQESVGKLDVKTKSVHFYVQRDTSFSTDYTVIPFESARLNEGAAMDLASGVFTAPINGIYHFEFSGVKDPSSTGLDISFQLNGANVGHIFTNPVATGTWDNLSMTASLRLKANDKVNLYNLSGTLHEANNNHYTHFTGWLVEEDF